MSELSTNINGLFLITVVRLQKEIERIQNQISKSIGTLVKRFSRYKEKHKTKPLYLKTRVQVLWKELKKVKYENQTLRKRQIEMAEEIKRLEKCVQVNRLSESEFRMVQYHRLGQRCTIVINDTEDDNVCCSTIIPQQYQFCDIDEEFN